MSESSAHDSKKIVSECPACGKREHNLPECWLIFKELKSQRIKLSAYQVCKAKKTVTDDELLSAQVKEIQEKMMKKVKIEK